MQEYVFRFMSGRPADLAKKLDQEHAKLVLYEGLAKPSALKASLEKVTIAEAERLVKAFRTTADFIRAPEELPFDVTPGLRWALQNSKLEASSSQVKQGLKTAYSMSISGLANDAKLEKALTQLADTILAQTVEAAPEDLPLDKLTTGYKLLMFVFEVAKSTTFHDGATVGDLVGRRRLIIPIAGKLAPKRSGADESGEKLLTVPPKKDPHAEEQEALRTKLGALEQAHRELSNLATTPLATTLRTSTEGEADRALALEAQLQTLSTAPTRPALTANRTGASPAVIGSVKQVTLSSASIAGLSTATKSALSELRIEISKVEPLEAIRRIEAQIGEVSSMLPAIEQSNRVMMLGGTQIDLDRARASFIPDTVGDPHIPVSTFCRFEAGIGDLLIVRQKLTAYELAEFAHVENVLAGETRSREHRRLDTTEEIKTTEETVETQKETDLQSTQRNEMQTEADKTVKQQFGLEAGVQISGSYGPSVQFSTHMNANFSTASEETQRKAVSFSQEVTEKTSQSIRQTIKQTLTKRVLEETQEINTHAFVNSSPEKDIRGIYRWLDKIYKAQIFNYGQRMLYEFVVPEPAAYFIYAMIENPPPEQTLVKPEPPTYKGAPLKPDNLTRANYGDYVAKYQVTSAPPPPSEVQTATYMEKQDGKDTNDFGRSAKIDLPDNYEAYAVVVATDYVYDSSESPALHMMIGNTNFDRTKYWGCEYSEIEPRQGEMSVAFEVKDIKSFTVGIDILCRLTPAGMAKWQESVFDSIMEAYLQQKADYEQALAAKAVQNGSGELGRNPAENLRITKEELKKLVLMILTGSDSIARDSYLSTSEPYMDLSKVCPNGSWIQFFEEAFEWTNMIYVLYSYFWGRHSRWNAAIHFTDPDPEFAAFLRAGAARVQVPVRPGFEQAVAYFCQYGEIWDGSDPPLREDELYVPIVDEIAANLGAYEGEGIPYPEGSEPWEVRIPTELVLVEDLSEVPNIRDALTGNNVTIHD